VQDNVHSYNVENKLNDLQVRLNKINTALGHKNNDFLELWEANNLMEWANNMQGTIDMFDNKKLNEIESIHSQIKQTMEHDVKIRVGNVDLGEKDLAAI